MKKAKQRGKRPVDVEEVPEQEAAWRKEIATLTVKLQEKRRALQNDQILRGVHPKSHGCVDADFIVNKDIGGNYRVGLFAKRGKRYKAKIRYSNAAVLILSDLHENKNGSRGMAIKVLDVGGPVLLEDGNARNQDFLMINTPEFAFRNVRDYRRLSRALAADEHGASPNLFFLPLELAKLGPPRDNEPAKVTERRQSLKNILETSSVFEEFSKEDMQGTLRSFQVVQEIQKKTVRNPLQVQYFSAAPFRYGPGRVMKFSVAPMDGEVPQPKFSPQEIEALDANYLAQALKHTLTQGKEIRLNFKVQVVRASQLKDRKKEMIENASVAWSEEEFPFVDVAQIVIHPVEQNAQLVDACKSLFFTPWHGLAAHEPLGGINRLRKPVYDVSAESRRNAGAAN
jgi:catalase